MTVPHKQASMNQMVSLWFIGPLKGFRESKITRL